MEMSQLVTTYMGVFNHIGIDLCEECFPKRAPWIVGPISRGEHRGDCQSDHCILERRKKAEEGSQWQNLPTPPLPERQENHDDAFYRILLEDYISKYESRPTEFTFVFQARMLLLDLKKAEAP